MCHILPRQAALRLAGLLGWAWFLADGRHRRRALENLEVAFGPTMGPRERRRVARDSFVNLARSMCDILDLESWDEEKIGRLVHIEGWERIEEAYRQGNGVLLFSGHIGCWELVPHLQGLRNLPLGMVVRPLDNPLLDGLLERKRCLSGNETIAKRRAVRTILRNLRQGKGVAIVIDQNLRTTERIFVEFFGRPAATTPALSLTAHRTGAAVVPVFCIPRPDGTYVVRYHEPVQVPRTGGRDRDVHALTQECTRIIEETIRAHPGTWLWMHRRWRTSPGPGEANPPGEAHGPAEAAASG